MAVAVLAGARVRERRLALGLRQAEVARRVGISGSYLNLIEHDRRRIGTEVLDRLAAVLEVAPAALTGTGEAALVEGLRAAAALAGGRAEVDRAGELVGRFPGWAALIEGQARRIGQLERAVEALNDRIGHDPHLAHALHEVLTSASSVRATAVILAETGDIDPGWRARFDANLRQDSERLVAGTEALVAYLDSAEAAEAQGLDPLEEVEDWLAGMGWHLAALEPGGAGVAAVDLSGLATAAARVLAQDWVAQAAADAAAMPLAAVTGCGGDPVVLAQACGTGVLAAMRRLALRPGSAEGLVLCDGAGAILLRKPVPGFPMPRGGAACPLWPLFAALARPGTPVAALGEMPGPVPRRYALRAWCEATWPGGFGGPEVRRAGMLIAAAPEGAGAALALGGSCRICPRAGCPARREPSILSDLALASLQARGEVRF
ncbi:MAG: short-chain fatty acyl-CoA regulator family protein [Gemmobacter sp.]